MQNRFMRLQKWLSGKPVIREIPERIQQSINAQQQASERIIGWAQLAIVLAFAVLYAITPKAFSTGVTFTPVPWFLGGYFLFTVLRIFLSYRGHLTIAFLLVSIVVDVALLFGLIWSFHIQYQQPASFYLKSPTLMYIFIFVALRALRFEAGFVIFTGMLAAVGWLLLSYYAITTTGMDFITRDYVEYMTSNKILIGAEWDKVISILVVTAILAAVLARGQKLLKSAVQSDVAAQDLSRFVPSEIAQQIKEGVEFDPSKTETEICSILFVDLEGFTTLSEQMTPQATVATLNAYFQVAAEPIQRYGGVINQFQGDAILASFNMPTRDPDHAEHAVKAGLEILDALRNRRFDSVELFARIGVNTGTVTGGLAGIPQRVYYTVHGDHVNTASRLEQLNKQFGTRLLVSEHTVEATRDSFNYRFVTETRLRGKADAIKVYTVDDAPDSGVSGKL